MTASAGADEALNFTRTPLDYFFAPRSVAVIGATETAGSVGRKVLWNLVSNPFGGIVYPVNPRRRSVLGIQAYPSIGNIPNTIDLAVICTAASTVPAIISECAASGVKAAIIISAGFRELGRQGAELEQAILHEARRGGVRIMGPNCLGVICPSTGLMAAFTNATVRPGNLGFISQSGAFGTAILDWSQSEGVGFSAFIGMGGMLDIGWSDLIDYLGNDPNTQSIVIYMESIGEARTFLSAAREVSLSKPIVVLKPGRSEPAAHAIGARPSPFPSDQVLDAAFRRCGVLRVDTIADMFAMSELLAKQPRAVGPRLTILTNANGPGAIAIDELITAGGALAPLPEATRTALDTVLAENWNRSNPIDLRGDASPERYSKALEIAIKNPESDGVLVILAPLSTADPTGTAEAIKSFAGKSGKPLLTSWMGGGSAAEGERLLNRAGVPTFTYPDNAARVFQYMWRYSYTLRAIYETPDLPDDGDDAPDRNLASGVVADAVGAGRTALNELETQRILAAYHIPTVEIHQAVSADAAVAYAEDAGYPIELRRYTTNQDGQDEPARLYLTSADAVRRAFHGIVELVASRGWSFEGVTIQPTVSEEGVHLALGSRIDPQFGPVLYLGASGVLGAVYADFGLALPPLNTTLARRMIERTRIAQLLDSIPNYDPDVLEMLIVRLSQLVVEQPRIAEISIDPLLVGPQRLAALSARIQLHDPQLPEEQLPRSAIRPYPVQYISPWTLRDGTQVLIRPIRAEDEPMMVDFHQTLSEQTVYWRFFRPIKLSQRISHERLARLCFIDYNREMALVAEHTDPQTGKTTLLGVGRLTRLANADTAEFAILVTDRYQRSGLGTELLRRLVEIGREEKLRQIIAEILPDNRGMQRASEKVGFKLRRHPGEPVHAVINLREEG